MTTHYHLIVETEQPQLSRGLHRLNGRYARYFNKKYGMCVNPQDWPWSGRPALVAS